MADGSGNDEAKKEAARKLQQSIDSSMARARRESYAGNRAIALAAAAVAATEAENAERQAAELLLRAEQAKRRKRELGAAAREFEVMQAKPLSDLLLDRESGLSDVLLSRLSLGYTERFYAPAPGLPPPPPVRYSPFLTASEALCFTAAAKATSYGRDDVLVQAFNRAFVRAKERVDRANTEHRDNGPLRRHEIAQVIEYFNRIPDSLFLRIMGLAQQAAAVPGAVEQELTSYKLEVLQEGARGGVVRYSFLGLPTEIPAILQRPDDTSDTQLNERIAAAFDARQYVTDINRVFNVCDFLQNQMIELLDEPEYVDSTLALRIFQSSLPLPANIAFNFQMKSPEMLEALYRRMQDRRSEFSVFHLLFYAKECVSDNGDKLYPSITENAFQRLVPVESLSSPVPIYMDNAANRDTATGLQQTCMSNLEKIVVASSQISTATAAQYILAIPIVLENVRMHNPAASEKIAELTLYFRARVEVLIPVARQNVEALFDIYRDQE